VLVVDDDPEIVGLISEWLGGDGRFEVRSAGTGYDAGLETERFRPALIVLDYMLPDINGNVVCRRVRETPDLAGTKILCVSGVVDAGEIEGLREAGADDFLKKPFDLNELVSRVEALLDMPARRGR
jgi:DNA-binding response OmpR family regulator